MRSVWVSPRCIGGDVGAERLDLAEDPPRPDVGHVAGGGEVTAPRPPGRVNSGASRARSSVPT